jgi:hypothetical protein
MIGIGQGFLPVEPVLFLHEMFDVFAHGSIEIPSGLAHAVTSP